MNFICNLLFLNICFLTKFLFAIDKNAYTSLSIEIVNIDSASQDLRILQEERKCNETLRNAFTLSDLNTSQSCLPRFDRVMCWPKTDLNLQDNVTVYLNCPEYINKFVKNNKAYKVCYLNKTSNLANWDKTKYDACIAPINPLDKFYNELDKHYHIMLVLRIIGYVISMVSLSVSILILAGIKRLRFPRNYVHVNFSVAIILRLIFTILSSEIISNTKIRAKNMVVLDDIESNKVICRLAILLFRYTGSVYHVAIFSEALYLVLLLRFPFYCEKRGSKFCILISWLLPLLWIIPWGLARLFITTNTESTWCWQTESKLNLITKVPHTILLFGNLISAVYILRVLYSKLDTKVSREKVMKYRRLAKSVMILIPIFGLHFTLFAWTPYIEMSATARLVFEYIESVFNSFQGLVVAIACCFIQRDVRIETLIVICNWYKRTKCYENPIFQCISPDYVTMLRHKYRDRNNSSFASGSVIETRRRSLGNLYEPINGGRCLSRQTSAILSSDPNSVTTNATITTTVTNSVLLPKKSDLVKTKKETKLLINRQSSASSLPSLNGTTRCYDCLFDKTTRNDFYQSAHRHGTKKRLSNDFQNKISNGSIKKIENRKKDSKKKFLSSSCKMRNDIKDENLSLSAQQSPSLPLSTVNSNGVNLNEISKSSPKVVHFNETTNPKENSRHVYNIPFKKSNIKNKNKEASATQVSPNIQINILANQVEEDKQNLLNTSEWPLLYQSIKDFIDDDVNDNV